MGESGLSEAGNGDPEQSAPFFGASSSGPGSVHKGSPGAAVIPLDARVVAQRPPAQPLPAQSPPPHAHAGPVTFTQGELRIIFGLYGRKVAAGEWRDYAMDFLRDQAIFSVYRRSSEVPLYRIEKTPRLARKQGEYAAVAASGLILKRGGDLARVLAVLDKPLKLVR